MADDDPRQDSLATILQLVHSALEIADRQNEDLVGAYVAQAIQKTKLQLEKM